MIRIFYDAKAGRYRDAQGRFISRLDVQRRLEKAVAHLEKELRSITEKFNAGLLTLAEWQTAVATRVRGALILAGVVARGGRAAMNPADWGRIGALIKNQNSYLNRFALAVQNGAVLGPRMEYRASLYARSMRQAFSTMERESQKAAGKKECRRVLHAMESCDECRSWADKGFVPIVSQPAIGSLKCGSNCRCSLEYR